MSAHRDPTCATMIALPWRHAVGRQASRSVLATLLACAHAVSGCGDATNAGVDAALRDAEVDGASLDGASLDAGSFDAGSFDAGSFDAASLDAAFVDALNDDAGALDMLVPDGSAASEWSSRSSLVHAGGGTNAIAVDPFDSNIVLTAGDVSGLHRSTNRGVDFANTSRGLGSETELNGVALAFSRLEPGVAFYLAGNHGEADVAGLFMTRDGGNTWSLQSREPRASGSDNPRASELAGEPRLVGQQVVIDELAAAGAVPMRRILYVGTYADGVLRSANDGESFESVALPGWPSGAHITGLHLGPINGAERLLFVGVKEVGIWRVRLNAESGAVADAQQLEGAPLGVEEIAGNAHLLLIAAGLDGAYISTDDGASFERAALEPAFADGALHGRWTAAATRDSSSATNSQLWLGCYSLPGQRCTTSLIRSDDGGVTWRNGVASPPASPLRLAESDDVYWASSGYAQEDATLNESLLGGRNFKAYQIALSSADPEALYVAANGIAWRTVNDGATWEPIGRGVGATVAVTVAHAPSDDGSEVFGMYDWSLLVAPTRAGPIAWHRPDADTRTGRAFAYERLDTGGRWVMALALQDNAAAGATLGGSVWTATPSLYGSPPTSATWVDEGLDVATDGRVVGVAVGRDESGRRVLLASVANGNPSDRAASEHACNANTTADVLGCAGLFRKVEDGPWVQVLSARDLLANTSAKAPIVWTEASQYVYFLDARRGLFASRDAGATFSELRNYRDGAGGTWGHLAVQSGETATLFVSRRGESGQRIEVVDDGVAFITTESDWSLADGATIGPVATGPDGSVFAASLAAPTNSARLWRSVDGSASFSPISDSAYEGQAIVPTDIAVSPSMHVTVSCWGTGFVEVAPVS